MLPKAVAARCRSVLLRVGMVVAWAIIYLASAGTKSGKARLAAIEIGLPRIFPILQASAVKVEILYGSWNQTPVKQFRP